MSSTHRARLGALALVVAATLPACGSNDSNPGGGGQTTAAATVITVTTRGGTCPVRGARRCASTTA